MRGSVPVSENDIVRGKRNASLDFFVLDLSVTRERVLYPRDGRAERRGRGSEIDSGDVVSTPRPEKDLRVYLVSELKSESSLVLPNTRRAIRVVPGNVRLLLRFAFVEFRAIESESLKETYGRLTS